jgi:hypothetical protein
VSDVDALYERLAVLRADLDEEVRRSRGLSQDAVRAKTEVILKLIDQIEAVDGRWATLRVNQDRRAVGLPKLERLTDLAADPSRYTYG